MRTPKTVAAIKRNAAKCATRWNAEAGSRLRLDGGFRLIVLLPGQFWGQPVQQHVKAACGRLVGASQGDARLPRKTARSLDLTRRRQRVEAHDEDLDEIGRAHV